VGLRAGLDWCGKSRPTGIRSPDRPACRLSLYRLRYPAYSIFYILTIFNYVRLQPTKETVPLNNLLKYYNLNVHF